MPDNREDIISAGQKVRELAHDLSNHLNSIVLQASCLLLKIEEKSKQEVELIRQEGIQAAALLRSLETFVQQICPNPQ